MEGATYQQQQPGGARHDGGDDAAALKQQLSVAQRKLQASEAKRHKLLQHLESLKEKTMALLAVADRNKELEAALQTQQQQQQPARRQQQRSQTPTTTAPPPPPPVADVVALRREVGQLKERVGQLAEALKRSDARAAQLSSRLTTHGAQLVSLQQQRHAAAAAAAAVGGAGSACSAAAAGVAAHAPAGPALLLPPAQLQQVVDAVAAHVTAALQPGSFTNCRGLLQSAHQHMQNAPHQQQHHQQHWHGQQQLQGAAHAPAAGLCGSRAASVEPECSGAAQPAPRAGAAARAPQHHHLRTALPGASIGRASSLAAAMTATAAPPAALGGWAVQPPATACGSGSLSSVMHSGATLQEPGSPCGWATGTSRPQAGGGAMGWQLPDQQWQVPRQDWQGQQQQHQQQQRADSSSCSDGSEEVSDGDGGGSTVAAARKRPAPCAAGCVSAQQPRKQRQQQQQQQQQSLVLRLGKLLLSLRTPTADAKEAAVAAALADEAVGASAGTAGAQTTEGAAAALAQAFQCAALSGAAPRWRLSVSPPQQHELGSSSTADTAAAAAGWARDPCGEAAALARLARCARLLQESLPTDAAAAFGGALDSHLSAAAHGAGGGALRTDEALLPLACAAAAAHAHVCRELGRAATARALVSGLLQRAAASGSDADADAALPPAVAAVAAWPQAFAVAAAGGGGDGGAANACREQLAALCGRHAAESGAQSPAAAAARLLRGAAPAWWGYAWQGSGTAGDGAPLLDSDCEVF